MRQKAAKIKWLFCDIDGTLTDGKVYYSPNGELLKRFSMRDGTGFFLLKQAGIKTGIITGENSPIVAQRAKKLQVDKYIYGVHRKIEAVKQFLALEGIDLEEISYIGDDLNDVKVLEQCGLSFAVMDADIRAKESADIVCEHVGGDGAFREAAEILLNLKGVNIDKIIEDTL